MPTAADLARLAARLDVARGRPQMMLEDLEAQRERTRAQRFDGKLTAEKINTAETTVQEELVALREEIQADLAEVSVVLGQVEESATGPTPEDRLLHEMRETRGWERAKGMLDAGVALPEVIESAGANGDASMLSGIRAELVAYVSTEALRRKVDPETAAAGADLYRRRIDYLLAGNGGGPPLLPGELVRARADASDAIDFARAAMFEVDAAIEGFYGTGNGLERSITRRVMAADIEARNAAAAQPYGGTLGAAIARRMERPSGVGA